jgi:hypothetical protein
MHFPGTLALAAPPALGVPSLGDSPLGWLLSLVVLVVPSVLLARRSHQIFGHWTRHFAQWQRLSWWGMNGGSFGLALGIFTLMGVLPTWNAHYAQWIASARTQDAANATAYGWLAHSQAQFAQLLSLGALALLIFSVGLLAVSIRYLLTQVLVRRTAVAATPEWMMAPPITRPID